MGMGFATASRLYQAGANVVINYVHSDSTKRFGSPDDIANALVFLCSPLADYTTGQTLHVNGGWLG
jgi:NAD(P)-dependent dehydrogenase (short-subunit alcohol dehydrogenase family)